MLAVDVDPVEDVLLVPREAVILTGKGARVVLARDSGRFEARAVDAEDLGGDEIVIRSGLDEGDLVVVSAQFLLDSEANLQAGLRRLTGERPADGAAPRGPPRDRRGHPLVGPEPLPGPGGHGPAGRLGPPRAAQHPARRHTRPLGRPGHRQDHLSGAGAQVVEDQVTYPIATALRAVTGAVAVRATRCTGTPTSTSSSGRHRLLLGALPGPRAAQPGRLAPAGGGAPELGPDATAVGWVYQYALVDRTGTHDLAQLRSLQDWFLKFELQSLPGVSEVANGRGMVKQYQVVVDPDLLRAYQLPLMNLMQSILRANGEAGAGALEMAEARYMIRVGDYLEGIDDLREVPVTPESGMSSGMQWVYRASASDAIAGRTTGSDATQPVRTVLRLGDIADVRLGPAMREGIASSTARARWWAASC